MPEEGMNLIETSCDMEPGDDTIRTNEESREIAARVESREIAATLMRWILVCLRVFKRLIFGCDLHFRNQRVAWFKDVGVFWVFSSCTSKYDSQYLWIYGCLCDVPMRTGFSRGGRKPVFLANDNSMTLISEKKDPESPKQLASSFTTCQKYTIAHSKLMRVEQLLIDLSDTSWSPLLSICASLIPFFPILSKVMPSSSSRFSWVQRVGPCMVLPLASMMLVHHLTRPLEPTTADRMGSAASTVELSGSTWWDPNTQCNLGWIYQPTKKKRPGGVSISCVFFFKLCL